MKILRSGKDVYVAECDRCSCVFSFGEEEVETAFWRNETYFFLYCPECKNKVNLPGSKILWMTRGKWESGKNGKN